MHITWEPSLADNLIDLRISFDRDHFAAFVYDPITEDYDCKIVPFAAYSNTYIT